MLNKQTDDKAAVMYRHVNWTLITQRDRGEEEEEEVGLRETGQPSVMQIPRVLVQVSVN